MPPMPPAPSPEATCPWPPAAQSSLPAPELGGDGVEAHFQGALLTLGVLMEASPSITNPRAPVPSATP